MPLQPETYVNAQNSVSSWSEYEPTPLVSAPELASALGIEEMWLKDETGRLQGIGSFKALGGGYAVEQMLKRATSAGAPLPTAVATASAGNHGIGIAWSCRKYGLPCHVFLSEAVSEVQANRICRYGATVHRVKGPSYEASLAEAKATSEEKGWSVMQDVDWKGYQDVPQDIFAGYRWWLLRQTPRSPQHLPP
jgi:diaminopropionate ammonia-lyase